MELYLVGNQIAILDEEDYDDIQQFRWFASWNKDSKSFYAQRNYTTEDGIHTAELMHRRILGLKRKDGRQTDHINHDTLDNRRENLRIVNHRQNGENRKDQSKYGVGIRFCKYPKGRPFQAIIQLNRKRYSIGHFSTSNEASEARKKWLVSK